MNEDQTIRRLCLVWGAGVERHVSKSLASGVQGGVTAPFDHDPSLTRWRHPIRAGLVWISQGQERPLIDGCGESEVSREW